MATQITPAQSLNLLESSVQILDPLVVPHDHAITKIH